MSDGAEAANGAPMLKDRDEWMAQEHDCPNCGWSGCGLALHEHEVTTDIVELHCPACQGCVALALAHGVQIVGGPYGQAS
jgi:hypothetical protein